MDSLAAFLKIWEETGDIAQIMEQDISLPSPAEMQAYLASLDPAQRDQAVHSLNDAILALEEHTKLLQREQADTKRQIDQNLKSAQACLSYFSTDTRKK